MSSSLLLGSYSIQEQSNTSRSVIAPMTSVTKYGYYEESERSFIENISANILPTIAMEKSKVAAQQLNSSAKLKKCSCCPYGYHIDLDFIRYCEELAANGKQPTDTQLERRNKRRQRKSLEVMLGYDDQWLLDFEKQFKQSTPQRNALEKQQFSTVHEVFEEFEQLCSTDSPLYDKVEHDVLKKKYNETNNHYKQLEHLEETKSNSQHIHAEFVNNILSDVCSDFERTLKRASSRSKKKYAKQNGSCLSSGESAKNEKHLELETAYLPAAKHDQPSVTAFVHTSHRSTVQPSNQQIEQRNVSVETFEEKATVTQNIETNQKNQRIDELSVVNQNLSDQLQSVRNQLTDNLMRVRDFEERIRLIPKLQLELSVEKAENRDLHLKLKALENVIEDKKLKIETLEASAAIPTTPNHVISKPFSSQRVCAVSLESLNIRFPNSCSPTDSLQSIPNAPDQSKQSVGCMTMKSITRDVGVVTIPANVTTRSTATNTDVIKEQPLNKCVGTQCEIEAKAQMRTIGVATEREVPVQKPITCSVGIMAVPNVRSKDCTASPATKSVAVDNIYQKARVRSFGTDPIKQLTETQHSASSDASAISLKLLDVATTHKLEKPKELKSVAIQHLPQTLSKFSQCNEITSVELQPKVTTQTEYTDTSDLILHIHRAVNTDTSATMKNQFTNTKSITAMDTATNTVEKLKSTSDTGTNPDANILSSTYNFNEKLSEMDAHEEHQCHNCLAKIEIKQQTIIKNPTKTNIALDSVASTSTSTIVESHEEDMMQAIESQSRIPRPTALISPRPDRKFVRQNTYTIPSPDAAAGTSLSECPAEAFFSIIADKTKQTSSESHTTVKHTSTARKVENVEAESFEANASISSAKNAPSTSTSSTTARAYVEDDEPKLWNHSMKSSSTYSQLATSSKPRLKAKPSKEIQAALKVINDSLLKNQHLASTLKNANKIVQKEWFRISSTEHAQPFEVEDYLDFFEEYSPNLLKYVVNMTDANGNTAMHYAVSHGNFDVVSILLDSKVCNINNTNNAGYTCVMLVSLATLDAAEHQTVVQRLFQMADVNVRAKKHSQTALMLATSHGNYNMVRMLLDAGADINIQDEDGSTALMCAAEHGRMDIIKILLSQPDCDSTIQDLDGSSALKISLEAGYRDIGVLLYAHEYMIKNKSPYTSLRSSGRSRKHSSSLSSSTNALPGSSTTSVNATISSANDPDTAQTENGSSKQMSHSLHS